MKRIAGPKKNKQLPPELKYGLFNLELKKSKRPKSPTPEIQAGKEPKRNEMKNYRHWSKSKADDRGRDLFGYKAKDDINRSAKHNSKSSNLLAGHSARPQNRRHDSVQKSQLKKPWQFGRAEATNRGTTPIKDMSRSKSNLRSGRYGNPPTLRSENRSRDQLNKKPITRNNLYEEHRKASHADNRKKIDHKASQIGKENESDQIEALKRLHRDKTPLKSAMKKSSRVGDTVIPSQDIVMSHVNNDVADARIEGVNHGCQADAASQLKPIEEASESILNTPNNNFNQRKMALECDLLADNEENYARITGKDNVDTMRKLSEMSEVKDDENFFVNFTSVNLNPRMSEKYGGIKTLLTPQFCSKRLSKNKDCPLADDFQTVNESKKSKLS